MFSYLREPTPRGVGDVGVAFTDRRGGVSVGGFRSLNFGRTDVDELAALRTNMSLLRARLGIAPLQTVHQVHGTMIRHIDRVDDLQGPEGWLGDRVPGGAPVPVADSIVCTLPDVPLAIRVADCVPVVLADVHAGVIGAAHAGRVGLLTRVLQATIDAMASRGATSLEAWVGPHICGRCYEVPDDMAAQAYRALPGLRARSRWHTASLDLGAGTQAVLEAAGVRVHRVDPCTLEHPDTLFSHRGSRGRAGRQIGLIWRDGSTS
ncbi:laccase domain-containing protein [Propionibacterium freudenreichii]|uniref:polyphenol oxidase family protein n=1 Tax=Propionibacterium freudenreichii TaxID=1744 RepID=UPI000BC2F401|nr:polyphenol oxidase family protein [Propionibacterium freudenreichii]MDK9293988.1 laccase domain-containing protein [Propionibacterium freudenreichii]MDK9353247.1 laccase domain-containing protein [Propionibacterium freudenreichii]MDK9359377.1 laccase domain-containing protein [Propionibacterium freudenreichii]MDK9611531.1 laccase domain-containing protein [Propionibacterium freudenreichii]MDK9639340.1 laccase domain-containing protein [Propionibacterium freudenreichii]